jgi:hypothetical protein
MAAPYNPPTKGEDFKIRVQLRDMNVAGSFKAAPTIATGDFKVDIDGGGLTNLATLPTVSPAGSTWVVITLSASEMNGDVIAVQAIDQTVPKEWADWGLCIPTSAP